MAEALLTLPNETWKPVPRSDGCYAVSSLGRVASVRRRIILQPHFKRGYARVGIYEDRKQRCRLVHRLVCEAFHGPAPSEIHHAAHNNGDPADNRAENLRWATPLENSRDRVEHGNAPRGSGHKRAKLDEGTVYALRLLTKNRSLNRAQLARSLGVDRRTLNEAISGEKWQHVAMP